jgi:hypothetical protein
MVQHLLLIMVAPPLHILGHEAEHVLYLVTGYRYFLPVIDAEPTQWRPTSHHARGRRPDHDRAGGQRNPRPRHSPWRRAR